MTEGLKPMLRLTTSRSAYRRAGLVIGSAAAPTLLTLEEFEQLWIKWDCWTKKKLSPLRYQAVNSKDYVLPEL